MRINRSIALLIALHVFLCLGISACMLMTRNSIIQRYSTEAAREDWQQWRIETQRQASGEGPVSRRAATSEEPPVAVLLRDHFLISWLAILVMSSVVYLTFGFLLLGSLKRRDHK